MVIHYVTSISNYVKEHFFFSFSCFTWVYLPQISALTFVFDFCNIVSQVEFMNGLLPFEFKI